MPGKRARGPPKEIPKGADPLLEVRLRQEAKKKELERQKKKEQELSKSLTTVDSKLSNVKEDHSQVVHDTKEVLGDITREFKVQQNNYRQLIEEKLKYVAELEEKLDRTQRAIQNTKDEFDHMKHVKDEEIKKNIIKSEQMVQEFHDMLKGTLVKMGDSIELSRETDETQSNVDASMGDGESIGKSDFDS